MIRIGMNASSRAERVYSVGIDYTLSVIRSGGVPLMLPTTDCRDVLFASLDGVSGLLLTGGNDVNPAVYREDFSPVCGEIDDRRDAEELLLLDAAFERKMPILCICRGIQMLNCYLGGTLFQDIAACYKAQIKHDCYTQRADLIHTVSIRPGSLLHRIEGTDTIRVNSRHHQAVAVTGKGLEVSATAPDGLIEAVELPGEPFVLGVQWHPESMSANSEHAKRIFDAFVHACEAYSGAALR